MSFKDKVVLITGASSGFGAAAAFQFAKEGANVVIVGRNQKKLKIVGEKCEAFGKKLLVVKADVSKDFDGRNKTKIMYETIARFGRIDVLVNGAGTCKSLPITNANFMEGFDSIVNTNLRGMIFITHLAIPRLIKTKGNIINISGIGGIATTGDPDLIAYCVAKAGVIHFTKTAALKLSSYGVRVNSISQGVVQPDIDDGTQISSTWEQISEITPLKRVSEPEEIADLILFLASHKACGITGSDYVSDNGLLIKS